MKGRNSRHSHRDTARYNAVKITQGSMITDADQNEDKDIRETAFRQVNHDAMGGGVPEDGGAIALDPATRIPSLREGRIYAAGLVDQAKAGDTVYPEGLRGNLAAAPGTVINGPLDLFDKQADLPMGPSIPHGSEHVIYADLWVRAVFPVEDPYLVDPGLHGAETAYRSRIMTQIKAAPKADFDDILHHSGGFPHHGTGAVSVTENDAAVHTDECDPCAGAIKSDQTVSNALFRLQVVFVEGPADAPTKIGLAWSEENAGEIVPAVLKEEIRRDPAVYEYCSEITECHVGVFADPSDARHSSFSDSLDAAPPRPNDHDGNPWPFIRRWDGYVEYDLTAPPPGTTNPKWRIGDTELGGKIVTPADTQITLKRDSFTLVLKTKNRKFVKGDYWLVELRRFASKPDRIRLVSEHPTGIRHFYLPLFVTDADAKAKPVDDDDKRKLSFPTLSDIAATHVDFDPACGDAGEFYAGVENVQQALDRMCTLSAEDVAYESACDDFYPGVETVKDALDRFCTLDADDIPFDPSGCLDLYEGADTVQEALIKLCGRDLSTDRLLRYLSDWGVVCGIKPKLVAPYSDLVFVSDGTFLDPAGRLLSFKGGEFSLRDLPKSQVHFKSDEEIEQAMLKDEVCLAVALTDLDGDGRLEKTALHLAPKDRAMAHVEKGFFERAEECARKIKTVDFSEKALELTRHERQVYDVMTMAKTAGPALKAEARFDARQFQNAEAVNKRLLDQYAEAAGPEEAEIVRSKWAALRADYADMVAVGDLADYRRAELIINEFGVLHDIEMERRRRCLCDALLPPCPPRLGEGPFLVPIACLKGSFDGFPYLEEVCALCCRKQAITLRSVEYYFGTAIRSFTQQRFGEYCCPGEKEPEDEGDPKPKRPDYIGVDLREYGLRPEDFAVGYGWANPVQPDYSQLIDVRNVPIAAAATTFAGFGVEVAERIDLSDKDAMGRVLKQVTNIYPEERLTAMPVRPGDKVALLVKGGVAVDWVKVEHGEGRLPYEWVDPNAPSHQIDMAAVERVERAVEASNDLRAKAEEVNATYASVEETLAESTAKVETIKAEKEALNQELAALREEVVRVNDARAEIRSENEALRGNVEALAERHTELSGAIASAGEDLEALTESRSAAVETIAGLKTELSAFAEARERAAAELAETRAELNAIRETREEVIGSLARDRAAFTAAREENERFMRAASRSLTNTRRAIEEAEAKREELARLIAADREGLEERRREEIETIMRIREGHAPSSVETDPEKAAELVRLGISTVSELAKLDRRKRTMLVRGGVYTEEDLAKVRAKARDFLRLRSR